MAERATLARRRPEVLPEIVVDRPLVVCFVSARARPAEAAAAALRAEWFVCARMRHTAASLPIQRQAGTLRALALLATRGVLGSAELRSYRVLRN